MRHINDIVIHHSASPLSTTAEDIERWHLTKGWNGAGYHIICESTGNLVLGRELEQLGAHVWGSNKDSIGICLVGDNTIATEKWTAEQIVSLRTVLTVFNVLFPGAITCGHRDMPNTSTECPGLDVRELLGLDPL